MKITTKFKLSLLWNTIFKVNDKTTWWSEDETVEVYDSKLGKLKIPKWEELHFRSSASDKMSLIKVQRLDSKGHEKKRRPLWLVWVGEQFLELKDINQKLRRANLIFRQVFFISAIFNWLNCLSMIFLV